ncbi:MAG: SDR family oxidoreductase [Gaiellaceae bacterium]
MGRLILLTGATGYVGARLLRVLEERGDRVRCLARRPEMVRAQAPTTEVVRGDVLDPATLTPALAGADAAYYLVHSLSSPDPFVEQDRLAARRFAAAALEAGIGRIVYLGGLGGAGPLSSHLASRQEVGAILRESGVPTVEFRASVVIGSGSASFEIVRALADRLPVMVTPRWVDSLAQPIAVEDLIAYLVAALDAPLGRSRVYEIGGPDRVTYGDLIREYARQRGLRRVLVPVPVLTPRLSSLWLALVTPVYARIGRKMVDSMRNDTIVEDDGARRDFDVRPREVRDAIARALVNEDREFAETRWSDEQERERSWGGTRFGPRLVDSRSARVPVPPEVAFAPIQRIGGAAGWYYGDAAWRLRGFLDLLVGGAGLRRGRRDPVGLATGATVDFWRVEALEPDRLLRLAAEMRLPGRAWLQFEVDGDERGSTIRQTAIFDPAGVLGRAYWYALWPVHGRIFGGMLRGIVARASAGGQAAAPREPRSGRMEG